MADCICPMEKLARELLVDDSHSLGIWPVCFGEGSPRQNRNLQRSEIIRCGVYHVGSGFLPRFFTVADGYVSRNYRPLVWQAQANSGLLHSGNLLDRKSTRLNSSH